MRSNVGLHYRNLSEALPHATALADTLLCPGLEGPAKQLECLRAKPMADIVQAQLAPEFVLLIEGAGGASVLLPVAGQGENVVTMCWHPTGTFCT